MLLAVCCGCVNGLVEDLVAIKLTFLRSGITAEFVENLVAKIIVRAEVMLLAADVSMVLWKI